MNSIIQILGASYSMLGVSFILFRILERDFGFVGSLKVFFKEITLFDKVRLVVFFPMILSMLFFSILLSPFIGMIYIVDFIYTKFFFKEKSCSKII